MIRSLQDLVWQRARHTCEYCRMPQALDPLPFQIDHIIAEQHGGRLVESNLCLACLHCNKHKGPNLSGVDPVSGNIVRLFDPRRQSWKRHFRYVGPFLRGQTQIGRATITVLAINDPFLVAFRRVLIQEGAFPSA
jgi:hypothetical protein